MWVQLSNDFLAGIRNYYQKKIFCLQRIMHTFLVKFSYVDEEKIEEYLIIKYYKDKGYVLIKKYESFMMFDNIEPYSI